MRPHAPTSLILALACALLGMLGAGAALAAWPDGYPGRVANMDALRWDMGYPGVGDDPGRTKVMYDKACGLKSSSACSWESWQGATGGDLAKAADFFGKKCPSDPQSCVVVGWTKSRDATGALVDSPTAKSGYGYFQKACSKAYAPACTSMGEMHLAGIGATKSYSQALKLVNEGCKAEDYYGCYLEGTIYEGGLGVSADINKAAALYAKACKNNVPMACVQHAVMLEKGVVKGGSAQKSAETYGQYCKSKVAAGCYNLGRLYSQGRGVERKPDVAIGLYKQACDAGELLGCFGMAITYESGDSAEGDASDAAGIYEKTCNTGHGEACIRLGKLYMKGRGVAKDEKIGVGFIQRACDAGNADGCDVLGQLFESGNGVEMNLSKATAHYTRACDSGEGRGCYHLGKLYQLGKGVGQNAAKAGELFQQACATGHGTSCGLLARAYLTGDGVKEDPAKAAELLEKGCRGGDGESCAKVGGMYQNGATGVTKDEARAVGLYQEACALESGIGCFTLGKAYETGVGAEQSFKLAIGAYKDACKFGYETACDAGGTIAFQANFQTILENKFESNMCQLWSFDPEKPDKTALVADVRGNAFMLMDGPRKGQTITPTSQGTSFDTGKIFKGYTKWTGPGGKKGGEISFSHYETWNSAEDPIDAFPSDEAYSNDRDGDTRMIFLREEEQVQRNAPSKTCKFGSGYPVITTEHCSEIQALIGAQLLTSCKGE